MNEDEKQEQNPSILQEFRELTFKDRLEAIPDEPIAELIELIAELISEMPILVNSLVRVACPPILSEEDAELEIKREAPAQQGMKMSGGQAS